MKPDKMTASDFARHASRLAARTACLGAALSVAGLLISRPVALGMLLGVTGGYVKLKFATNGLLRFADPTVGAGRRSLVGVRLLNYALLGVVLFVAFSTPCVNEWAALAGVFLPNVVTILDALEWASADVPEVNADKGA